MLPTMSLVGTFQTCVARQATSAHGGKADLAITSADFRILTQKGHHASGALRRSKSPLEHGNDHAGLFPSTTPAGSSLSQR
jgi:hypothetical protein